MTEDYTQPPRLITHLEAERDRAAPVLAAAIEVADAEAAVVADPSLENVRRALAAHTALVAAVRAWRGHERD